jgi:hypothetical protein
MALGLLAPVSAQDMMDPCLGLSASDCDILAQADKKLEELTSFTQSFNFSLKFGGLGSLAGLLGTTGEGAPNSISITADGANGPFVILPDATDPFKAFAMAMDVNGAISGMGAGVDAAGTTSFVIVDGNFYLKDPESGQWLGFNLNEAVESGMLAQAGLPIDPADLLEGATSGDDMGEMADPTAVLSQLSALGLSTEDIMALTTVQGFMGQARLADASANGQAQYAFESTIDFAKLLTSPEFGSIGAKLAGSTDPDMAQVGSIFALIPMVAQEANIKLTRWIGQSDLFVHRLVLELNVKVDLAMLMGGAGAGGAQMEPITLNLLLDVQLSNHNNTAVPAVPEGAQMIPLSQLQGSGM